MVATARVQSEADCPLGSTGELLRSLRDGRGFDVDEVLASKVGRLMRWFDAEGLDAAVVGVSGGIDSAVVLGVLAAAQRDPESSLQRLVAAVLPVAGLGATGQSDAEARARVVAEHFEVEAWVCPLGDAHVSMMTSLAQASGIEFDGWSAGQLLAVERTPALYGAVALLRSAGHRAVVVGTTNRDEGAYLGFFGKASDGAVDLQPISDLHKSEVRAMALHLGLPRSIVDEAPRGDVWDGRSDEEMIGCSYDDVELVLRLRELGRDPLLIAKSLADPQRLRAASDAVDRLHQENRHKYAVGSPAVHLDVMPRGVPGGWPDESLALRFEHPPGDVPGRWEPPPIELSPVGSLPTVERRNVCTVGADVLSEADCLVLLDAMSDAPRESVGVTGLREELGVGSERSTAFDDVLSQQLWFRLAPVVDSMLFCGQLDPTDAHATDERSGHRTWRVVGLSPVLRFMRYRPGGRHLCHYDAGFDYGDGRRTLSSVVFFLTGGGSGGCLRFVRDGQEELPIWDRDHSDWTRDTRGDEVVDEVHPVAGTAVVFPHRRCHDVAEWFGPGDRVIVRADVVYERIPDGRDLG